MRDFVSFCLLFALNFGELRVEAIDAAVAGDEALLASVEGVVVGAGVDFDFLQGRAGLERRSTGRAGNGALVVSGMDAFFHVRYLLSP